MITVSKVTFLNILKFRPQWLIGKQIIYDRFPQKIHDVSINGDCILLDTEASVNKWISSDSVDEPVIIDAESMDVMNVKLYSVLTITKSIDTLEKLVGNPDSDTSKPLFETVAALNKEILDLKLKIDEIESKENKHEP